MVFPSYGCKICKQRKIKCDEVQPTCGPCQRTSRKCVGNTFKGLILRNENEYASGAIKRVRRPSKASLSARGQATMPSSNAQKDVKDQLEKTHSRRKSDFEVSYSINDKVKTFKVDIQTLLPYTAISSEEKRFLNLFHTKTAPALAAYYVTSELWSRYVLQVAINEPAILHAVVALSCLHEQFQVNSNRTPSPAMEWSIKQYAKAIKLIAQAASDFSGWQCKDTPLLACVLFGAFESMMGSPSLAASHRLSGLKLLAERQQSEDKTTSRSGDVSRDLLYPVFLQIDTENLMMRDPEFTLGSVHQPHGGVGHFNSLHDAWIMFEPLFNDILRALKTPKAIDLDYNVSLPNHMATNKISKLIQEYRNWANAFNEYLAAIFFNLQVLEEEKLPGFLILQSRRLLAKLILEVDMRDGEMDYDRFHEVFECMVRLAECAHGRTTHVTSTSPTASVISIDSKSNSRESNTSAQNLTYAIQSPLPTETTSRSLMGIYTSHTPIIPPGTTSIDPNAISSTSGLLSKIASRHRSPYSSPGLSFSSPRSPTYPTDPGAGPNAIDTQNNPTFTLSPGILCTLYIVATRCRDPHLRRRALVLLESRHAKEGSYDSVICAKLARATIEIEEATALQLHVMENVNGIEEKATIQVASDIPNYARLIKVETKYKDGKCDTKTVRFLFNGNDGRCVDWEIKW